MPNKNYKTTKEHFELFKKTCEFWLKELGLTGYQPFYEHTYIADAYATVQFNIIDRNAIFCFTTDYGELKPNKKNVQKTAYHEVCELFIGRLAVLGETRYIGPDDIREECHNIIRTMENVFFKEVKV